MTPDEKRDPPKVAARPAGRSQETEQWSPPPWAVPAVMITILVVGGWFIIQNLADTSRLEDCQMAGRKNCVAPIDTSNMR
jgi:hypothetical protein